MGCGGKPIGSAEEAWEFVKGAGASEETKAWFAMAENLTAATASAKKKAPPSKNPPAKSVAKNEAKDEPKPPHGPVAQMTWANYVPGQASGSGGIAKGKNYVPGEASGSGGIQPR